MSEEITESAKAVQEVAKATGQSITFAQGVSDWLSEVVGEPIKQAVGMFLTDRIKAERLKRAIFDEGRLADLARKVNQIQEGVPVSPRAIEPKVAIPLLEAATMEFDEDLHTLWAKLLASAMDQNSARVDEGFVGILSEFSPEDAKFLEKCWIEWICIKDRAQSFEKGVLKLNSISSYKYKEFEKSINKFTKSGIVEPNWYQFQSAYIDGMTVSGPKVNQNIKNTEIMALASPSSFRFTSYGEAFCSALGMNDEMKKIIT